MKIALLVLALAAATASAQATDRQASVRSQLEAMEVFVWLHSPLDLVRGDRKRHWTPEAKARRYEFMAKKAAEHRVAVAVKVHDGIKPYKGYDPALLKAFERHGVKVLLWGYNHCNHPKQEAALIFDRLHQHHPCVIGYLADPEGEMENPAKWPAVDEMMRQLKGMMDHCSRCRGLLRGYAPFPLVEKHRNYPYHVLGKHCDFSSPQLYWRAMGRRADRTVRETFAQWLAWEIKQREAGNHAAVTPMVPSGQAYGGVMPAELRQFLVETRWYYAIGIWDWKSLSPPLWDELAKARETRRQARIERPRHRHVAAAEASPERSLLERFWGGACWVFWRLVLLWFVAGAAYTCLKTARAWRHIRLRCHCWQGLARFALGLVIMTLGWYWFFAHERRTKRNPWI